MNLRSVLIIIFAGFVIGGIVSFFLVIEVERAHFVGNLRLRTRCISPNIESGGEITDEKDKIRRSLRDILAVTPPDEAVPVIIQYKGIPSNNCLKDLNERTVKVKKGNRLEEKVAFERRFHLINAVAANLTKSMIKNILSYDREILQIEPDLNIETFGEKSAWQIQADEAREKFNIVGRGVKIAVIDTGVAGNNDALKGKIVEEKGFTGDFDVGDWIGHGSHLACIIACDSSHYQGVAPGSRIYDVKVIDREGYGRVSAVIAGMQWAVDQWVDVINLGVGAEVDVCDGTDAWSLAVDAAVDMGIVVVVAAGNNGPVGHTLMTPGCARSAITVGAVDNNSSIASFSLRRPTDKNYGKIDIYAPGVSIEALTYHSRIESMSGTSQASAYVTGVIALLKEVDESLSRDDLLNILTETQDELRVGESGIVNVYEALKYVEGR